MTYEEFMSRFSAEDKEYINVKVEEADRKIERQKSPRDSAHRVAVESTYV